MRRAEPVILGGDEEVRPLADFGLVNYYATSCGRILSTFGVCNQFVKRAAPLHEMAGGISTNGYRMILMKHSDGKNRTHCVHELVGLAFLGNPPVWHEEYRHLDNNKLNCAAANLAFGTKKQNADDRRRAGTMIVGSKASASKLNEALVLEIRQRVAAGPIGTLSRIARELGMKASTLSVANRGITWAHVPMHKASGVIQDGNR